MGALPAGFTIPANAPPKVQTAIRWALGRLGTPYQWDGSCTAQLCAEYKEPLYAPPPLLPRMVDAGRLGRTPGSGFYPYP